MSNFHALSKAICLVWFGLVRWDFLDCVSLSRILGTSGKPLARRGAWVLFCGIQVYGEKALEFQSFYELKNYFDFYFDCGNNIGYTTVVLYYGSSTL